MTVAGAARWAEVDLQAITANAAAIRERLSPETQMAAVVKTNAYGHGAVAVSRALTNSGVAWLAVATVAEAAAIRDAGVAAEILVLGPTYPAEAEAAVRMGLHLGVSDASAIRMLRAAAARAGTTARLHLKVDTGMARLGAPADTATELARLAATPSESELAGTWTHFAEADDPLSDRTAKQLRKFTEVLAQIRAAGIDPGLAHAANSAGTLLAPSAHFDMVRCGLVLYGYLPTAAAVGELALQPALTWKARVVALHDLDAGDRVGYGGTFVAPGPMRTATISAGYGDGYRRALGAGGSVLIRGRRAPLVGVVSMDFMSADVSDIPGVELGDEVVLLGRQGAEAISADDLARQLGTISWEILVSIGPRVERVYFGD